MIIFNLFLNGGKKLWNKIFGHVSRPRLEIHACSNPSLLVSEHCFNMKNFGDTQPTANQTLVRSNWYYCHAFCCFVQNGKISTFNQKFINSRNIQDRYCSMFSDSYFHRSPEEKMVMLPSTHCMHGIMGLVEKCNCTSNQSPNIGFGPLSFLNLKILPINQKVCRLYLEIIQQFTLAHLRCQFVAAIFDYATTH